MLEYKFVVEFGAVATQSCARSWSHWRKVLTRSLLNYGQRPLSGVFCSFCLGDGLAQLVTCQDGKTCLDISSFDIAMAPTDLTPLSWSITGADIAFLLMSSAGEEVCSSCSRLLLYGLGSPVGSFGGLRTGEMMLSPRFGSRCRAL